MALDILKQYLTEKGYDSKVYDKFVTYYNLLIEWNNKFNLTSITDEKDVQIKHFIDSLLPNDCLKDVKYICDIGCGAGFPSIPLAFLNEDKNFTLVDSVNKKITFIDCVIDALQLKNVSAIHSRAEDFAQFNFQKYDACVARALAQLPTLAEYTLPLLKKNGILIAYKGKNYLEEINQSQKIIKLLSSQILDVREYDLTADEKRFAIIIKKIGDCSKKYPRKGNKPRTQPILG